MYNDPTTLRDLSVFTTDNSGIFYLLEHTTTHAGRDILRKHILHPPGTHESLQEMQDVVRFWTRHTHLWPGVISNGTLVMLEKFFESSDNMTTPPKGFSLTVNGWMQRIFNRNEYFFTQFSVSHLSDFLKGCAQLAAILKTEADVPPLLQRTLATIAEEMVQKDTRELLEVTKDTPYKVLARLSFRARRELKHMFQRLLLLYSRMDAWVSMAKATVKHQWNFPELLPDDKICLEAKGLFHPLLREPVAYDIHFSRDQNFLVLTGANMSGKTTFMRAIGVSALLAHLGMGVPAQYMRISFLKGLITNMHVEDNLLRGESYFFAEVQRMKMTAEKLVQQDTHLVLMDELFKGTNVHDAYECTRGVVEGLLHRTSHLMILSTHLYEVAQHFSNRPEIIFSYFVTEMTADNSYHFTYQLKNGISNDRIGYKILQKEGVLDLLRK